MPPVFILGRDNLVLNFAGAEEYIHVVNELDIVGPQVLILRGLGNNRLEPRDQNRPGWERLDFA